MNICMIIFCFFIKSVMQTHCLKTIQIEFIFVSIPASITLFKANMNMLIQYAPLFVITLNNLMPARRNIIGFLHKKMLAYYAVETL